MTTAKKVLEIAQGEVGYDRYSDPERGTKYGRWYEAEVDKCKTNYDYGANGVAYCAMFVSWVFDQAKVECPGLPGAYCPSIHHFQMLTAEELKPGDIVLFDWEDDGTDDHIGIVKSNDKTAKQVKTYEGNTSGGKVLERTRAYSTICGGIRPKYSGASASDVTDSAVKAIDKGLVEKVANGDYGNGAARTKKLEAEGYDASAVQVAVNAYLRGESFGAVKPATAKAVKYKVLPGIGLNIRSDAKDTAKVVGGYSKGAEPTVTATKKDAAGNTWGKTNLGWIALVYKGETFAKKA